MQILFGLIKHYTVLIDESIIEPEKFDDWKNAIEQYPDEDIDDLYYASELLTKINRGEITDKEIGDDVRFRFFRTEFNSINGYRVKDNLIKLMFKFANDPQEFKRRLIAVGEQKELANVRETIDGIYNEIYPSSQERYEAAAILLGASAQNGSLPSADDAFKARDILNGAINRGEQPCKDTEE